MKMLSTEIFVVIMNFFCRTGLGYDQLC